MNSWWNPGLFEPRDLALIAGKFCILVVLSAIPYGIVMGIYLIWRDGFWTGFWTTAFSALAFGWLVALGLMGIHFWMVRNLPGGIADLFKVVHRADLTMDVPKSEAFRTCVQTLPGLVSSEVRKADPDTGIIVARTGPRFGSFGERIEIQLHSTGPEQSRIVCTSRPLWPTALMDFGINRNNVVTICERIRNEPLG